MSIATTKDGDGEKEKEQMGENWFGIINATFLWMNKTIDSIELIRSVLILRITDYNTEIA